LIKLNVILNTEKNSGFMNKEKSIFENTNTKNITSFEEWYVWYSQNTENIEKYGQTQCLLSSNANVFKDIYGEQDFCTYDSSNRRLWAWKQELPSGFIWLISDNKERGTSYEVSEGVEWSDIQNFIEDLKEVLFKKKQG
tara:strand:+ start:11280 stop:11696 length:417 start_codon:yes stop_codon:yes gene_type:complete